MDPTGLGPIQARLTLEGQILSVTLTPRLPTTHALLVSQLDALRQVLQTTGLQIREVQVVRGKSTDSEEARVRSGKQNGGFDVRA
jgi:flagellar hook-length control protein FliK